MALEVYIKILGISGRPNKNGDTAFAVRHALEILTGEGAKCTYLTLAGKNIRPCTGCWACQTDRRCPIDDDMAEILDAMRGCDGMIIGSPVYFGMVSGTLKNMMDRSVPLRPSYEQEMELTGKVGAGIACGGFRNGGQETILQNIHTFLLQQNMRVVSDGRGYSHAGGTIMGEAKDDTLGLRTVENLARNMFRMVNPRSHTKKT